MQITEEQFSEIFPTNKHAADWSFALSEVLEDFGIATPEQVAMFLAQCGHESAGFTVLTENLNYSSDRLKVIFPKYFKTVDPAPYHRKPEKIANRVYANRMGNGDEASGEGYKYRGRGVIQLTGKSNYAACSESLYGDPNILLDNPDGLLNFRDAILSGCWFWEKHSLQDIDDIVRVTKIINGGTNGLPHREELFHKALEVLSQ